MSNTYNLKRDRRKNDHYFWLLLGLMALLYATCNLAGCYTPTKADKQLNKALTHYPAKVAEIARNSFPCTPVKSDTVINIQDSLIELPCDTSYFTYHDTVRTNIVQKIPVHLPVKTVYITKRIEDSAKLFLQKQAYEGQLLAKDAIINELTANRDSEKKRADDNEAKAKRAYKWNLWLLVLLMASLAGNYLQFRKK